MLDTTSNNLGRLMAVLFIEDRPQLVERDGQMVPGTPIREEKVINDARINGVFSNRFEISGLSVFEARELALLLRAGSLAAPIVPVEERTIGPSLGQENIDRGIEATLIGYLLVVVFIGLWYRVFGMLANIALLVNVSFDAAASFFSKSSLDSGQPSQIARNSSAVFLNLASNSGVH